MLFGGFTYRHERLIEGVFHSLGYKAETLPTPNVDAFQTGKEYGNNGQCNPTYFTVGNLVQYLQYLRDEKGLFTEEIEDHYVFFTAGACGPCRFGMYEAEYRLALRNAGFERFRVILFQQKGGLQQSDVKAGLELSPDFFIGLVSAINVGDLLNELAAQIRPYEVRPGETERVLRESLEYLYRVFRDRRLPRLTGKAADLLERVGHRDKGDLLVKFLDLLTTEDLVAPLREVAKRFDAIEVDRTIPKPVVKITGEFWAQTTDGDGNFNMFKFLQAEGAEIITEPIATWLSYMLWQEKIRPADRRGLDEAAPDPKWWEVGAKLRLQGRYWKKRVLIELADRIYRREYDRVRMALGGTCHPIVDMWEMERLAHEFYHSRSEGGEGHLEVAKNIYYTVKGIAHMVLSLKPFGCMPSTQSDGAQSAVVNRFKDMIFLPIETSGEGEINAHSRVQMALGEAKAKAKSEFNEVLAGCGYTLDEIRAYVAEHPELRRPLYHVPHVEGVVGTAARFVHHVAERMRSEGIRSSAAA
ncbi:MAG: activator of (R)-2-hydroxyglutaryl-CoA dehydratase [Deltaproteobacteria bacterium]|nr:MAG: activator of (R)-2-hydroxyglutaryl-CoA dehydratase [Deltaproteobacteria bacterium]